MRKIPLASLHERKIPSWLLAHTHTRQHKTTEKTIYTRMPINRYINMTFRPRAPKQPHATKQACRPRFLPIKLRHLPMVKRARRLDLEMNNANGTNQRDMAVVASNSGHATAGIDWSAIRNIVDSPVRVPKVVTLTKLSTSLRTDYILHECIRRGAPVRLLHLIVEKFPEMLFDCDLEGRYPIHIACEVGASAEFVLPCIELGPLAAAKPDGEGKTPMHLLCQAAGWQGEWDIRTSYRAEITIFQIFLKLFYSNCYSLCLQDCGGLTPLEYALRAEHQGIFIEKVIEYQKRADTRRL